MDLSGRLDTHDPDWTLPQHQAKEEVSMFASNTATQEIEEAKRQALLNNILATLRGEDNHLIPFEWVRFLNPRGEHYIGTQTILVDQIIGSVDRYDEFDQHFLPLTHHLDERWVAIRKAQIEGKELPAIQVYKVGDGYFVKDGNHRVSVAKSTHQKYIDAEVIELDVNITPQPGESLKDMIIRSERVEFYKHTRLDELRPEHAEIDFSTPGRYDILLEHIRTRQYYLGIQEQRDISWDEAVISWYDKLYWHVVRNLRRHNVMTKFPGRTEADMYLWVMDHRYFLTEQLGHDVGSEYATLNFKDHFRPHWWERLGQRMQLLRRKIVPPPQI